MISSIQLLGSIDCVGALNVIDDLQYMMEVDDLIGLYYLCHPSGKLTT